MVVRLIRESRQLSNNSNRRGRRSRHPGSADAESLESVFFPSRSGRSRRSGVDTKSLQLCRQVQRQLDLALGELDDPILQGLWVRQVLAQAGGRSLLVEVAYSGDLPISDLLARLDGVRARLRGEIASAIHRKRTPYLQFMVVPPEVEP